MDYQLEGKLCLVSGSTAGIGFAIAEALAGEGARVILNGRTKQRVEQAFAAILKKHPKARLEKFAADLVKVSEVERLVAAFPEIDVLVNNLGIYGAKEFDQITDDDWKNIIEANFFSGLRLSRAYLPGMKKRDWGRIIFISSESAVQIPVEMIHYGVTKTMQVALARGLAESVKGTKVTVNSVLPGPTFSEGVQTFIDGMAKDQGKPSEQLEKEFFQNVRPGSLIQRFATNEEVANLVAYVASPLSSATNGAALRVEGGVVRSIL
jgi:NAD(P)-dependent dehydrogenase (short-subunit alcohol dehydrogenase family)